MVAGRRRKQKLRGGNGRQTRKAQNLNNECDPMNAKTLLPGQNPTASPMLLHTICLNQGRVAIRSRHAFAFTLLARAERLAAAGGGALITEFGLCRVKLLRDSGAAILILAREDGTLGSGGLAWQPRKHCLWQMALAVYTRLQRDSGQRPHDRDRLKPRTYPWFATILMPGFLSVATQRERIIVETTLHALAFGILEHVRKSTQRN